jgi:plasmid stabilization system protein ParE
VSAYYVHILPSAERDIEEAYCWLAERDVTAAIRWYNRLLDVIATLESFPERCPLAPEKTFLAAEIREIFHGRRHYKYRVLFRIKADQVQILHVRHGARLSLGETPPVEE